MKKAKDVFFLSAGVLAVILTALVFFKRTVSTETVPKTASEATDTLNFDAQTGLIEDKNLMLVKANCTACHSAKLIQQHRFSREGWEGKIRWMQKNHNLWDLGPAEISVLDYLEKYYSPESASNKLRPRRAPLKNIEWYKYNSTENLIP